MLKRGEYRPDAKGPLNGIRILDLSRLVAGNTLTGLLADFGAEVIKVEPDAGDTLRAWRTKGVQVNWKLYARNKKSLALELRTTEAKELLRRDLTLPTGYTLVWSGQYENMARVRERLLVVVPLTIALIALLPYLNTRSGVKTAIVLTAVPFSLIGAVWLLWALGYNLSIAVWVGMIALMGLDAETGVFMLLYLDLAYDERVRAGTMRTRADLEDAVVHGAVKRVRPKLMTVVAAFMGLLPIMWSTGAGADVMKRIAAPMVGGLATSFALELLVYPVLYATWRARALAAPAVSVPDAR